MLKVVNMKIRRLIAMLCVLTVLSACISVYGAGINENCVASGSKQTITVGSPERVSYTVNSDGRYRLKITAETAEESGIMVRAYKNEDIVWMQYIPGANSGTVDVRMLADKNDEIAFSVTSDEGKTARISYSYEITKYNGSLPINETAGNQGDSFKVIESTTLLNYIENAKTNGTRLYAVYNDKEFDMSYSSRQNYWEVNVLGDFGGTLTSYVFFRLNDSTADLGPFGGSPNVEIPITKDGMIHISGKIPGISQWYTEHDALYDDNGNLISGYYSQNYGGVCTSLYKNDEKLWSSRVGEASVKYDEEYDTSYFRENIDVVTRVKAGDVLRFSFDAWRNRKFKADISDVTIDYIEGNPVSSATVKKLDNSLVFDLHSKQLTKNRIVTDADIVFKDKEAYLAGDEADEIFGSVSGVDEYTQGGTVYKNLSQVIEKTGMTAVKAEDRLLIAHEGISGQYSYDELSRIDAAFCGDEIMTESGAELDFSNLPDRVRIYSKIKSEIISDTAAGIYLAGYRDNKLIWVDIATCTLKPGDTVVSKVMELDNTKNYDRLSVFVWSEEMSPLTYNEK